MKTKAIEPGRMPAELYGVLQDARRRAERTGWCVVQEVITELQKTHHIRPRIKPIKLVTPCEYVETQLASLAAGPTVSGPTPPKAGAALKLVGGE